VSAFTDAVDARLNGMRGVSTGECPGCERCAELHRMSPEQHRAAWHDGKLDDAEGSFSWATCGICGTTLGGDRHVWHWIHGGDAHGAGGSIEHENNACTDCVYYLANGDEPESWRALTALTSV